MKWVERIKADVCRAESSEEATKIISSIIDEIIREERERCARIAETLVPDDMGEVVAWGRDYERALRKAADAIRGISKYPPRVVCAWCKTVMREGSDPVSHGICPPCAEKQM